MPSIDHIAILDTNAYHGDVFAKRQHLSTMFDASDSGLVAVHIWTPRAVVEELVRQFSGRLTRMRKVLGTIEYDLNSFGLTKPAIPNASEEGTAKYRKDLEARLTGVTRTIAPNPAQAAVIVEWAAQRRHPIKEA